MTILSCPLPVALHGDGMDGHFVRRHDIFPLEGTYNGILTK